MQSQYLFDDRFYAKGHIVYMQSLNFYYKYGSNAENPDSAAAVIWRLNIDSMQYFPTGISFTDGSKLTSTTAGNEVTVNYNLTGNDTIGIDTGHLVFHYNANALVLNKLQLPPSWVVLDSSTKNGVLNLTITADSNAQLPTPIVQLTFGTYLSTGPAKVYLDSANLSGHRLNCDCKALSLSGSDSVEVDFSGCGDSLILAAMRDSLPFYIQSIVPNPASSSIEINLSSSASIVYTLFDELGNSRLSGNISPSQSKLDVTNLQSGDYYIRLSSNGYVQTRKIEILR
jgi:hypothetical protein